MSHSELLALRDGADWGGARVILSPEAERLLHALVEPRPSVSMAIETAVTGGASGPVLDDDGLLHFHGRWVTIPDSQLRIARLLVRRFRSTVLDGELAAAYCAASHASPALTGVINRLGRRVAGCDLALQRVRLRGYILDRAVRIR